MSFNVSKCKSGLFLITTWYFNMWIATKFNQPSIDRDEINRTKKFTPKPKMTLNINLALIVPDPLLFNIR